MQRRQLMAVLAASIAAAVPAVCVAQANYPAGPVKLFVGFPAGTAADLAARAVGEQMARRLGQPFVVENRPGAGSNIAAKAVATAAPDGYTLFAVTIANTINAAFPNSQAVDPAKEFAPITMMADVPNVLVVRPSLNVSSVAEMTALAKSKPGDLSFGSSGIGTAPHLSGELYALMAGIKWVHVPYKGSTPAVADLLGGQVQLMFSPASTVLPHVRAGTLKALAVTSLKRTAIAPDLPTLDESGMKGFQTSVWVGLVAPLGTPAAVTTRLRTAAHAAVDSPEVQAIYKAQGIDAVKTSEEEFSRFLKSESDRWTKFVAVTAIKPE